MLLGPDGAGKSSVIEAIGSGWSAGFAECRIHHLRPVLGWGRHETRVNCDPHGRAPRGALLSMLKLIYLLVVNWLGYLMAVRPQMTKGRLVLFDRYFPDCLIDPRRYRLPESCRWMAKIVAMLLPEPDLYVVLDAPACVLQERKREVTPAESERQRTHYAEGLTKLANVVMVDAARPLPEVVEDVVSRIIDLRLARYHEWYKVA